jgi:hypothetical protein
MGVYVFIHPVPPHPEVEKFVSYNSLLYKELAWIIYIIPDIESQITP